MSGEKILRIVAAVLLFAAGYAVRAWTHTCPTPTPEEKTEIKYVDRVQTEIAYVPKETIIYKNPDGTTTERPEDTDVDMQLGKQQLNVKVNGRPFAVKKTDDEKFIFDKNKLQVTQSSSADLNINVPTIDKTKRWEIGVGISKDGAVGMIGFPIRDNMGGWIAGRSDNVMAGVNLKI